MIDWLIDWLIEDLYLLTGIISYWLLLKFGKSHGCSQSLKGKGSKPEKRESVQTRKKGTIYT